MTVAADSSTPLRRFLDQQRATYDDIYPKLKEYSIQLADEIVRKLNEHGVAGEVTTRVKNWEDSLDRKVEEGRTILEIQDLIGVRVVVMYEDQIRSVALAVRELCIGQRKRRRWSTPGGRSTGYMGLHVQAHPIEWQPPPELNNISAELQIRTQLQHVWAELSHREFYKAKFGVPAQLHERLHRLAASLDVLNDEVRSIRDTLRLLTTTVGEAVEDPFEEGNWRGQDLDEFTLSVVSRHALSERLGQVRRLGRECGFRESEWLEHVRVGAETETFVPYAHENNIRKLSDLDTLITRTLDMGQALTEVAESVKSHCQRSEEPYDLFERPLYVLAIALTLENPTFPCRGLKRHIVAAAQQTAFRRETTS